ncbi:MAG: hypothetical protein WC728_02995 [Elusimicrobiota bacterium]
MALFSSLSYGEDGPKKPPEKPAAEEAADPQLAGYERDIGTDFNPAVAEEFLRDTAFQERLKKSDPAKYQRLFKAATEAKDMETVLKAYDDPSKLRLALASHTRSQLLSDPAKLKEWARQNMPGVDPAALEEALWGWGHLSFSQQAYLSMKGFDQDKWEKMGFFERDKLVLDWGTGLMDGLMQKAPKTKAQFEEMDKIRWEAWGALRVDQRRALGEYMKKADTAVQSIAEVEKKLKASKDPKLKAMLASAKSAGSVDATLTHLSGIYDGLGMTNTAVAVNRPAHADEQFNEGARSALSSMFATDFRKRLEGTTAGDAALAFYEKNPLQIAVRDIGTPLAHYDPGTKELVLNEKYVRKYLQASGKTVGDLLTDKKVFDGLAMEALPTLLHESVHQQQHAWALQQKVPVWFHQDMEVEAMSMESLFILEKARSDPAFKKMLDEGQARSTLISESVALSNSLYRDVDAFRSMIRADYYPALHTLEGRSYHDSANAETVAGLVKAELARRDGLSASARRPLDEGGSMESPWFYNQTDPEAYRKSLEGINTAALRGLLIGAQGYGGAIPGYYQPNLQRRDASERLVDKRIQEIRGGTGGASRLREPPLPPGGGG